MKLYHATFSNLLPSIEVDGLIPNSGIKNFDQSKEVVCLANSAAVAYSFAECSELIDEGFVEDTEIIVLEVDLFDLDLTKLHDDSNVIPHEDEPTNCFEYHGTISWDKLSIHA